MTKITHIPAQDINSNSIDTLIGLGKDFYITDVENISQMHNLIVRDLNQKNLKYTLNTDNVEPLVCDPFTMGHTQGGSAFFSTLFYFLWLKIHNLLNAKRANVAIKVESYQQQILLRFPFS